MRLTDFTLRVTEALVCYSESVTRVATENTAAWALTKILPPEFLLEILSINASLYYTFSNMPSLLPHLY